MADSTRQLSDPTWLDAPAGGSAISGAGLRVAGRLRGAAVIFWVAAFAVIGMPSAFELPLHDPDPAWHFGIVLATLGHLQFGTEIIQNYGPLGFLEFRRGIFIDPGLWAASVAFAVAVHLALTLAMGLLLREVKAPWWLWAAVLGAAFLPLQVWPRSEVEMMLLTILTFTLALRRRRRAVLLASVGGALVALQVMTKETSLISGGAVVGAFAAVALLWRRYDIAATAATAALAGFLVLWGLTGQAYANLPAFWRGAYETVTGYTAANATFARQPAEINPGLIRSLGIAIVLLSFLNLATAVRRRDPSFLALALAAAPLTFLTFKEGFVRWHVDYFVVTVVFLQLILLGLLQPWRSDGDRDARRLRPEIEYSDLDLLLLRPLWGGLSASIAGVAPMLLSLLLVIPIWLALFAAPGITFSWPSATIADRLASYGTAAGIMTDEAQRNQVVATVRRDVVAADPLPPAWLAEIGGAPVDVVPYQAQLAYGYHLNWRPRPSIQSYQAFTPYLDSIDATSLRSGDAPRYVLISVHPLDDRYPMVEEPAYQRTLLENYRTVASHGGWTLLKRAAGPCPCDIRELGSTTAALAQRVAVPRAPGARVFVRIHVDYTAAGRAANLLLDPGAVHLALAGGGSSRTFSLVPATATDGVLVSSMVSANADLARLYSGCDTVPIDTIAVWPDAPSLFHDTVTYDFFAETIGSCDSPRN
ncbi:MAG TPA: hypothetical protein VNV65_04155 [Candidatus Solibacter sp.]|nr:hypothetical protein [Candidatus Solibacter sp.]